jgi:hypothetical protein
MESMSLFPLASLDFQILVDPASGTFSRFSMFCPTEGLAFILVPETSASPKKLLATPLEHYYRNPILGSRTMGSKTRHSGLSSSWRMEFKSKQPISPSILRFRYKSEARACRNRCIYHARSTEVRGLCAVKNPGICVRASYESAGHCALARNKRLFRTMND